MEERIFIVVTKDNFKEVDKFTGNNFSSYGYREDVIGNIFELSNDLPEEVEFAKKHSKYILTEEQAKNSNKQFIYTYGYPETRLILYNWEEYQKNW